MEIFELIGRLFFDQSWHFVGLKDGAIEIWENTAHGWIDHVVRATGEVIEVK